MKVFNKLFVAGAITFMASCAPQYNLYDYYQAHTIDQVNAGETNQAKSKLLMRDYDGKAQAQLELIAYKTDSAKYLVVGSQKITKNVDVKGQVFQMGVSEVYPKVKDEAVIRMIGDYTVYYTHISWEDATKFMEAMAGIKQAYAAMKPANGEVMYLDYAISSDVRISFSKSSPNQQPTECVLWVGKRRHFVVTGMLMDAMNYMRTFN